MTNNSSYIKAIDGLRAFAIVFVVIYHLNPNFLEGGFTGVDIFFVISGYVVTMMLYKINTTNFFEYIGFFYRRRIQRILPALVVFLSIGVVLTNLFVPHSWLSNTTQDTALSALFGFSNIALVFINDGYFSPRADFNPFIHTWSLGVEEQFYLVFPLILFASLYLQNRLQNNLKNNSQSKPSTIINLLCKYTLIALILISLVYSAYEVNNDQTKAYYFIFSRFWELACGAVLYQLHHNKILVLTKKTTVYANFVLGLVLIILGALYSDAKVFPFPWAILSVAGTVLLISSTVHQYNYKLLHEKFLELKPISYLGKISYSLYLWHWLVISMFKWTIGFNSAVKITLAVVISIILAMLSYHLVEQPFLKNKYFQAKANKTIIISGLIVLLLSFASFKTINQSNISLSVTSNKQVWYPYSNAKYDKNPNDINEFNPNKKIFVIGDSHAGAYKTMLNRLKNEYGYKYKIISSGGCPLADLLNPGYSSSKTCQEYINKKLKYLQKKVKEGDIVFLASLRMNRLSDQWTSFELNDVISSLNSPLAYENRAKALNETIAIIQQLQSLNVNIIIDAPKPVFQAPMFRCSDWFNKSNEICSKGFAMNKEFLLNFRQPVMNSISTLKQKFPNLIVWDPFPILCPNQTCFAYKDDKPLFFDGDHLSGFGNNLLYPNFKEVIKSIK